MSGSGAPEPRLRLESSASSAVARLVLMRGERGNAIDMAFAEQFEESAQRVLRQAESGAIAVVVVEAEGSMFCVGGDLDDFPADPNLVVQHLETMVSRMHRALGMLTGLPVPVVTRVQGVAAGAGLGLVAFGDVIIASSSARFQSAYTAVGLSPDLGVSWLLPKIIGPRRAADMVLTNRMVSADEAEQWGLVSRVVAPDCLDDEVDRLVQGLLAVPRSGVVESKRLLGRASERPLSSQLVDEAATIVRLSAEPDACRAREEFLSRR